MEDLDNLLLALKNEVNSGNQETNYNNSALELPITKQAQRKSIVSLKPSIHNNCLSDSRKSGCELVTEDKTDETQKPKKPVNIAINKVSTDEDTLTTLLSAFSDRQNILSNCLDSQSSLQNKNRRAMIQHSGSTAIQPADEIVPDSLLESPFEKKRHITDILNDYQFDDSDNPTVEPDNTGIVVQTSQSCANLAAAYDLNPGNTASAASLSERPCERDSYIKTYTAAYEKMADTPTTPTNTTFGVSKCAKCHELIHDKIVMALHQNWHVEHFQCDECLMPIGNLTFFERDEKVLCIECFEANYMFTCAFCKESIRGPYITAFNTTFHAEHFFCGQCGKNFPPGEQFFEKGGHPYCQSCYSSLFAMKCDKCDGAIVGEYFTTQNKHYHKSCFTCEKCSCAFSNGAYFIHNGKPYCESHYYEARDMLCNGCSKPVMGRCIMLNSSTRFHFDCFKCAMCSKDLRSNAQKNTQSIDAKFSKNPLYEKEDSVEGFKEIDKKPYCLNCCAAKTG